MQSYEASFLPPDPEYVIPEHSETSEIMEGNEHFGLALRALAEYHADEEGGLFRLSYEREQELAEAVHAGRLVEAKRAERAAAEAVAAAEAEAAAQAASESPEEPTAEPPVSAIKEAGATEPSEPVDDMVRLDELDEPDGVEDAADTHETVEVAELSEEDKADEAILQAAAHARRVLVEANARFALYYARASVGFQPQAKRLRRKGNKSDIVTEFLNAADVAKLLEPPEVTAKPALKTRQKSQRRYKPKDKTVGTYTNIAGLASKYAELEDRSQNALVGLVKAAAACKPHHVREEENGGKKLKPARFVTFAAWAIQREIVGGIESSQGMEMLRPRVPIPAQEAYYGNCKLFGVDNLRDITLEQYVEKKGNDKGYYDLNDIQAWMEREAIYMDDMVFPHAAPEEETGYEGEEQPLSFAEMFSSVEDRPIIDKVDYELFKDEINMVLATLNEREAGILRLRFGLIDGQPRTLDEIGLVYGIRRERVRQIENQVMSKMRHRSRSEPLKGYLNIEGDGALDAAYAYAGDGLRTEHTIARLSPEKTTTEGQGQERRWHRRMQRELLPYLNSIEHLPNEKIKQGTPAYREVYDVFTKILFESGWQFWADREMHEFRNTNYLTSYPDICNVIDEYIGDRLSVEHIAAAWNNFLFKLPYREEVDVYNRMGQLTSRLLSTRMKSTDVVELHVPQHYDYECGFMGAWLQRGHLIIHGNAGDYVGMHMGGNARITVLGDVGYDAGYGAGGNARLEITGATARRAGQNMRDNAVISMASTRVRGGLGKGRRDNAQIIVGGEPLESPTPRRVIQMSPESAKNYQTSPPPRSTTSPAESQAPDQNQESGEQYVEAPAVPLEILDVVELDFMGIDGQVPPLPLSQEENIPPHDDFSTMPRAPRKRRQKASPQPMQPATSPTSALDEVTENTDATPKVGSPVQDDENETAELRLALEAASAYFDISPDAFQKFADQVGYAPGDLLRIDDIVAMQSLIPVLRLPAVPETGYITVAEAAQRLGFRGTAAQFAKDLRELHIPLHRFRTYDGKAAQYIDESNI